MSTIAQLFLGFVSPDDVSNAAQPTPFDASPEAPVRATGLRSGRPARRGGEVCMDALVNQLARELADAITAAVTDDARVEACREKARAAGLEMRVSLEAVISFGNRANSTSLQKVTTSKKAAPRHLDMTANDRRFLKSLRISADEPTEKEVE
jgi:hypothetical protein